MQHIACRSAQGQGGRWGGREKRKNERNWRRDGEEMERKLKNYQHSTEGQKFHQKLAPALAIISGYSWVFLGKSSGDPNPQYFSKSTAVQMGGVLPYKWEAYCSTNGRRTAGFPFLRSLAARKARRYKWGAYCRTNWRCTAVLFRQVVGVGVSETLPI